jgi:phosphopantothenoylcysteine decarboxylase
MSKHIILVVTGAPLATRTIDVATEIQDGGWSVNVVATESALAWLDIPAVMAITGCDVYVGYRTPGQPKRGPEPDAVVVCPATFNTINKVAHGISDNYAVGVVCEAVGQSLPVVIFPMINDRLWQHPARAFSFQALTAAGVRFGDVLDGSPGARAVVSGTGDTVVNRFKSEWVAALLP